MSSLQQIVESHHKALRKWSQKAMERNYQVDAGQVVWCPVQLPEVSQEYPNPKRSLLRFLSSVYYPGTDLQAGLVAGYAGRILKYEQNRWLESHVDFSIRALVKRGLDKLPAEQRETFELYDQGVLTREQAVMLLVQDDLFFLEPSHDAYYIYVPTADPSEGDKSAGKMARGQAGKSANTIAKRQDWSHFLYLDVGAWSGGGSGHAAFGIVTPDEVALWDILARSGAVTDGRGLRPGGMVKAFWDKYHKVLGGSLVFYSYLVPNEGVCVIRQGTRHKYSYTPRIATPLTDNQMLVFIPDLHLHLFTGLAADNFVEPRKGGESLAYYLVGLFDYLADFTSQHPVELIQVGDLYELWESALLLLFAREQKFFDAFTKIGFERGLMLMYRAALLREIQKRGLDKVFTSGDLINLEKQPWDSDTLQPVWRNMKRCIQEAHRFRDIHGREAGLFDRTGRINAQLGDWTHIGGNHDSFVADIRPRAFGVNEAVWVEHGHLRDPYNCPAKMNSGIFLTGINVIAEMKRVGEEIKGLESDRRPNFQKNAAETAEQRAFRDKGRPYGVIVTGHTHRGYAALLRVRKDLPKDYEPVAVLYDQGWPVLKWTDWAKALPSMATVLSVAGGLLSGASLTRFRSILRIMGGVAKYSLRTTSGSKLVED